LAIGALPFEEFELTILLTGGGLFLFLGGILLGFFREVFY
jgi:hypothetical protein